MHASGHSSAEIDKMGTAPDPPSEIKMPADRQNTRPADQLHGRPMREEGAFINLWSSFGNAASFHSALSSWPFLWQGFRNWTNLGHVAKQRVVVHGGGLAVGIHQPGHLPPPHNLLLHFRHQAVPCPRKLPALLRPDASCCLQEQPAAQLQRSIS